MITNDQRREAFEKLPVALKKLYDAPESGEVMSTAYLKHVTDVLDDQYIPYAEVIADTMLGLHTTTELPNLLASEAGLTAPVADQIVADLQTLLQPVMDHEQGLDAPEDPALAQAPDPAVLAASQAAEFASDTTPATLGAVEPTAVTANQPAFDPHAVQPMRTMEEDVNRVHGYGAYRSLFPEKSADAAEKETVVSASQDELLARPKPLADTPTYTSDQTNQT